MAIIHEGPAPYAPTANVVRAIDHYREKAPPVMSKELLMRMGYPDAYANRTLRALRMLDLITDDGTPTDAFVELQRTSDEEFPARLEQVIRTAYGEVFEAVDPATASDSAIDKAFRFYSPQAQRDKMVALFMGLCDAAGMLPAEKAPPKRAMRVTNGSTARKADTTGEPRRRRTADPKPDPAETLERDPEPKRPPVTDTQGLKARYIEVLIEKAASSDDEKLLDRIEALLREAEQKD
jgi:Family of unknown function (DUF5343)